MKKIVLFFAFFPLAVLPCITTAAGEHIATVTEKTLNEFLKHPQRDEFIKLWLAGNGLSCAAGVMGNRYLPACGTIKVGKIAIPVKALLVLMASYGVGYAPLISYSCRENAQ